MAGFWLSASRVPASPNPTVTTSAAATTLAALAACQMKLSVISRVTISQAATEPEAGAADNDPYIWTVPELLVECLSPSNRKGSVRELLADYAQIAVPEVWLLDPAIPQFTSYRYESAAPLEFHSQDHGAVSPLLLPNMTVDLDELWAAFHGRLK